MLGLVGAFRTVSAWRRPECILDLTPVVNRTLAENITPEYPSVTVKPKVEKDRAGEDSSIYSQGGVVAVQAF